MAPTINTRLLLLVAVCLVITTWAQTTNFKTTLDADSLAIAKENLGETDEVREQSLTEITNWITASKDQFIARTDPIWVLSFLRVNKFDIEKTKNHILRHMKLRSTTPEWFKQRDPLQSPLKEIIKLGLFLPLRGRDKHGRTVIILRMGAFNPSKYEISDLLKVGTLVSDILTNEVEDMAVRGVTLVMDFENYSLAHAIQLTPTLIQKGSTLWQDYNFLTVSMDGFHTPGYVDLAVSVFKQLLSKKFRNKVHTHGPGIKVNSIISRDILPKEYGGKAGTLQDLINYWEQRLKQSRDWLIDSEKYGLV